MKKIYLLLLFNLITFALYSKEKQGFSFFKTDNKIIYGICFTPKGSGLAVADNNEIKIFNTGTREVQNTFTKGHSKQIMTLDISQDSSLLVSGGKDSTIVLWDYTNGKILKKLKCHKGIITSLKISPDGRYLVSGATDDKVILYDILSDKLVREYDDHKDDITCVAFSPDGKLFAASGGDGIVTLYNPDNDKFVCILERHSGWVRGISFNSDGTNILGCGDDSRLIRWNIAEIDSAKKVSDDKYGNSWLLCIDNSKTAATYTTSNLNGLIKVIWAFGTYTGHVHVPVNKILIFPGGGSMVRIAIATRGRGVIMIDGSGMRLNGKKKVVYHQFKS
jgi:WD40 repeat protein